MGEFSEFYRQVLRGQSRDCKRQINDGCDKCISSCLCNFCGWVITAGLISLVTFSVSIFLTVINCDKNHIYFKSWNECTQSLVPVIVISGTWTIFSVILLVHSYRRKYKSWLQLHPSERQPLIQN